jgi:tRNA A-37 threonylcarbamoyl transferase component Bud32
MKNVLDQWFDDDVETCNISPIHVVNTLKKLGASKSRIKAVRARSDTCQYISDALSMKCLKNWKFSSYLGSGTHGVIFSVVNKSGTTRAAKIVTTDPRSEVKVQKRLAKIGIAPRVLHSCKISDDMWVVIMEKVDGSLGDLVGGHRSLSAKMLSRVYDELVRNIEVMEKKNISHGDLSLENVGYVILPDGEIRLILIDFGWSGAYVPMFDMVSLTQALLFARNKVNRDTLIKKMTKYIEDKYHYKLPGSALAVDTLFRDFQSRYIHEMRRTI